MFMFHKKFDTMYSIQRLKNFSVLRHISKNLITFLRKKCFKGKILRLIPILQKFCFFETIFHIGKWFNRKNWHNLYFLLGRTDWARVFCILFRNQFRNFLPTFKIPDGKIRISTEENAFKSTAENWRYISYEKNSFSMPKNGQNWLVGGFGGRWTRIWH